MAVGVFDSTRFFYTATNTNPSANFALGTITNASANISVPNLAQFPVGLTVAFSGSPATPFVAGTYYYVVSNAGSTALGSSGTGTGNIQLSASVGGAAIAATANGSGTFCTPTGNTVNLQDGYVYDASGIQLIYSPTERLTPSLSMYGYKVNPQTTQSIVPSGTTDVALQGAINSMAAAGGGIVYLQPGTYTLNNPVTLANNVSIIGAPTAFPTQNGLLSNDWIPSGGTIIKAGTATVGFQAANTAQGTGVTLLQYAATQLSGVIIENLCFSGFSQGGMVIGATNAAGLVMSRLRQIAFYNCGSVGTTAENGFFALSLKNFSGCSIHDLYFGGTTAFNGLLLRNAISAAAATDQTGNSLVTNVQVDFSVITGNSNFCRGIVMGVDPAANSQTLNEMRMYSPSVYAFTNRAQIQQNITYTGGGGNTQGTLSGSYAQFPVGMPVLLGANSGATKTGVVYFVLTNTGAAITLANFRGGAAVTNGGSGTTTITQYGYPLMDLGGVLSSTSVLTASDIRNCDLETTPAAAGICIYRESCNGVTMMVNQMTSPTAGPNDCMRNGCVFCQTISINAAITPDWDSSSVTGNLMSGQRTINTTAPNSGSGVFWDSNRGMAAFNIFGNVGTTPPAGQGTVGLSDLYVAGPNGGDQIYPYRPIGKRIWNVTGTTSLIWGNGYYSGYYSCEGSGITLTLPALSNASIQASSNGQAWYFININQAGTCIIKPSANSSGQFINNASALTNNQVSLAAASNTTAVVQWARFTAQVTNGGTTYWAVETTGTIS